MIESLIQHLRQSAKLEDSVQVERFEATLNQIAALNDSRAIGLLLPFFNDKCKFPEVMFSVIHTIERFDDETYVGEILRALPTFWKQSPYWANVVHYRILNHAPSCQKYRNQLSKADSTIKAAARDLLTAMHEREPKFREQCTELIAAIS